ncbi:MAG TPA: Maf family protein [Pyrinomonadaceae bacterium]|jgi:septum formation protein
MEKERERQARADPPGTDAVRREPLVLASASPRRSEILRAVGWPFRALAMNVDETLRPAEDAAAAVERLALEKATAAAAGLTAGLVLGADTSVVVDTEILGKPRDRADARRMLRLLSGRWHDVLTGVALVRAGEPAARITAHEKTEVRFADISDAELDWYVTSDEPLDKAGAYAVQGKAALFIEEIRGDYWNVVGLPVRLVYELAARI